MSEWTFVVVMLGLAAVGLLVPLLGVLIAFIRGYQMGWRDKEIGAPHAFPWPPLPKRLRTSETNGGKR